MPADAHRDRILILDFGSQYTQLIARRIREQQVYCEIHPPTVDADFVRAWNPRGLILSGGPSSVLDAKAPQLGTEVWDLELPTLAICYGLQLLAHQRGGRVEKAEDREYGRARLEITRDHPLWKDLPGGGDRQVWMSHGDRVLALPPGFHVLGTSESSPFAAVGPSGSKPDLWSCSSTRKSSTRNKRRADPLRTSSASICRLRPATGRWRPSSRRRTAGDPRAGG